MGLRNFLTEAMPGKNQNFDPKVNGTPLEYIRREYPSRKLKSQKNSKNNLGQICSLIAIMLLSESCAMLKNAGNPLKNHVGGTLKKIQIGPKQKLKIWECSGNFPGQIFNPVRFLVRSKSSAKVTN